MDRDHVLILARALAHAGRAQRHLAAALDSAHDALAQLEAALELADPGDDADPGGEDHASFQLGAVRLTETADGLVLEPSPKKG